MPKTDEITTEQERLRSRQGVPLGDTGDGEAGPLENEQGISNRPGDEDDAMEPNDDELEEETESEFDDPEAEPGKPI